MRHLDNNQILTDKQHGFRARRSCETQLILTIQEIANNMTRKGQTGVILLDFAKAFDKVPHHCLLHKLNYYGVRESTLCWIESFLSQRKQSVLSDGTQSTEADVLSRVPQGTFLGPLFFLAFINDLPESTNHSDARLFADDCLLCRQVKSRPSTPPGRFISAGEMGRNLANEIPPGQMHSHQNQHQQETDLEEQLPLFKAIHWR